MQFSRQLQNLLQINGWETSQNFINSTHTHFFKIWKKNILLWENKSDDLWKKKKKQYEHNIRSVNCFCVNSMIAFAILAVSIRQFATHAFLVGKINLKTTFERGKGVRSKRRSRYEVRIANLKASVKGTYYLALPWENPSHLFSVNPPCQCDCSYRPQSASSCTCYSIF